MVQTNTSSNRPRTQQPQQSQQPQGRPRTTQQTQLEDMEDDYINEDIRINNIVSHVIGREGRNIKFITSQHNTKAHYDSNTEKMTITGTRQRDTYKTIRDIKEIIVSRTQEQETTQSTPPTNPDPHNTNPNRPRQEENERYTYSRRELREPPSHHTQQRYRDHSPHHHQEFKHPRNH